jgi:hypothetical protein
VIDDRQRDLFDGDRSVGRYLFIGGAVFSAAFPLRATIRFSI